MSSGGEMSFAQHSVVEFKQGAPAVTCAFLPSRCYTGRAGGLDGGGQTR